ncbi:DUF4382 domain-containing protein [Sediminitomix flava]|uniref:Uncharacterized protein DUF4382 n=1 Tax=Sediminitomix flava TaxID=379075 RepID=A0A315ZAZ0_SEDFL|nr:DUF4382 domain-containing protein [Sediminitomix flava]PWJ42462.1 uncharacterized protein DUF4382 [Sediminitomix flava]
MKKFLLGVAVAFTMLSTACNDDEVNSSNQKVKVDLRMTAQDMNLISLAKETPSFDSIYLDVVALYIKGSVLTGNDSAGYEVSEGDTTINFNIMDYQDSTMYLWNDEWLAGTVDELEVKLGGNSYVIEEGGKKEFLQTPSNKMKIDMIEGENVVEGDKSYKLILNMGPIEEMIHGTGQGKYMLKPVRTEGYFEEVTEEEETPAE